MRGHKHSYKESFNKRKAQDYVFSNVSGPVVALGGPDIDVYAKMLENHGVKDLTIYENNRKVFLIQLRKVKWGSLIFGDILINLGKKAFYDLDFCCSIYSIESYLPEIVELPKFSITLSLRPAGLNKTLEIFRKYSELPYLRYHDSVPMITFYKT